MTDAQQLVLTHYPDSYLIEGIKFYGIWSGSEYLGISMLSVEEAWERASIAIQQYMIKKLES